MRALDSRIGVQKKCGDSAPCYCSGVKVSVVIPAYNEEKYLHPTMRALEGAIVGETEMIVVDNGSTDATREIAGSYGAKVVSETVRNIGHVRNTGAAHASGAVLVFLDADTVIRPGTFEAIIESMSDSRCLGGSAEAEYEPIEGRPHVRFFMKLWPMLGRFTKIRGGALQFCRADIFHELGGYDTTIYVGEDIDFHWRLDQLAKKLAGRTHLISTPKVLTSSRRWQNMSLLRMIFFTHPVTIFLAWRIRPFWKDWYERVIR